MKWNLLSLLISFIFKQMQVLIRGNAIKLVETVLTLLFVTSISLAQTKVPTSAPGKTIFRDSDGKLVSSNEFVDIRMANFHYPDRTAIKTLEDGTVEFRLPKIPQEGAAAPSFTVKTLDGKTINSSELKGKVVVLHFWFIGCPACLEMEPKLNDFKAKFAGNDDLVFLAMTTDSTADVKKYLSKEKFDYLQGIEARNALGAFVFAGYPKNVVIDRSGKIVYWRSTIKAWDKFESVVRNELAKE